MSLFTRSLWPNDVRSPYRRLAISLLASPAILSVILSIFALVLAGISEPSAADAFRAAVDSAITLATVVFAYTLSFGVVGVLILWWLSQRSLVIWASAGLVMGALGGFLLTELAMERAGRPLVIFCGVTSVALFLLMRVIAGVQDNEATD